ncbi:hypothetical protein LDENG_00187310 [Lucifuga dentata]|nr:hypothetical protein LDENG_00187310 [Lucifuga dentata]
MCRPFYLSREFTSIIFSVVYIPPQPDTAKALSNLHDVLSVVEPVLILLCALILKVDAGTDPWYADLTIRNHKDRFKTDTGADVSVLPAQTFYTVAEENTYLAKSDRPLYGLGGTPLNVLGMYKKSLCKGEHVIQEGVYVIKDLHIALLSRPASIKLNLVSRADSIDKTVMKESYPKLCQGLGMLQQPYTIKLKPDAIPFSLATPRCVPIPLLGKVKEELECMEIIGVISRVEEPTDWCSGMVPVPTKNGSVHICVDLTHLNEAVCREKYILPSVEHARISRRSSGL